MVDRREFLKRFLAGCALAPLAVEQLLRQLMAADTDRPPVAQVYGPGLVQWAGPLGAPGETVELSRLVGPCEVVEVAASLGRPIPTPSARGWAGLSLRYGLKNHIAAYCGTPVIAFTLAEDSYWRYVSPVMESLRVPAGDVLLVEGAAGREGQWCAGSICFRGFVGDQPGAIPLHSAG